MQQEVNKFLDGGLNADLAEHLIPPNAFISGQNFRTWSTDKGGVGYIENILRNAEKSHTLPSGGINTTIGYCADDENGHIVKFNQNTNGDDGIYLYDIVGDAWYTVLMSDDVTGGLNFDKYSLINGAHIINHILYWNDNNNEPRKLHLGAFMQSYHSSQPVTTDYTISRPVDDSEITIIRKPCAYPPSIEKLYDSGFVNNFIQYESYQFAVRYVHFEGEEAVLSPWSKSSLLNSTSDNYNYIHVILDGHEPVPQTVRLVQLVVKIASTNKAFVLKAWDRVVSSENTDINSFDLTFDFYGNAYGEALDDATLIRPFHAVPLQSGTLERGKNRNILADNLEGYDAPTTTSISLSLPAPNSGGLTSIANKFLIGIQHAFRGEDDNPAQEYAFSGWFVYLTEVSPVGWYQVSGTLVIADWVYPAFPAVTTTAALSALSFKGATFSAVEASTRGNRAQTNLFTLTNTGHPFTVTAVTTSAVNFFLPKSQYKVGIVFYDRYLRKCSVVFNDDIIEIPQRNYVFATGYSAINWSLSYANDLAEIPDWAYYYCVVRTLNLRTRYFVSAFDNKMKYATKNTTTGLLDFSDTFGINVAALAINANALLQANLGWNAELGDQCILTSEANNVYELPVIGQEGDYILLKPQNIGSLTGVKFVYELYKPYKSLSQEPFFETGEMYEIADPTTVSRTYSVLFGSFRSDTFVLTRTYDSNTYYAETMSPNDVLFERWYTDAGRDTIITKQGQVRKPTGISWSNIYIQGTQTNGLSGFEVLNKEILSEDLGTIRKAVLTTRTQKEGTVLLAIGEVETASIYLEESELFDAQGNTFLAKSDNFIGQVNILRGGYGTSNPESVVAYESQVSWFSKLRSCFVTYSVQGLFPISDNGMRRVSNLFAKKYASLSVSQIEALGSRPYVFGGYDPYHRELYFTIPSTESTPPKGYLADYVSPDLPVIYPYDIYDGIGKTLVYKIDGDRWGAPHNYQSEGFVFIRNSLYSSKNGATYLHDVDDGTANTYNIWYGVNQESAIGFIINENPDIIKEYLTLSIEGNNIQPSWIHHRCELPNIQSTDCEEFTTREGVIYEKYGIMRDRLSPNATGTYDEKLFKGDKMRGQWLKVYVKYDTRQQLQIRFFNVGFTLSSGQKI